ncbi:hypothetical protein [Lentzea californiensis]|uniref:hypothetical protein n=1 Tax=Lentzea californiensis TaxID=438851 RepID=UPI0021644CCB|nr:hypothetical protein [Lentzea californiensis]
MLALHRAGQQAEALAVHQEARMSGRRTRVDPGGCARRMSRCSAARSPPTSRYPGNSRLCTPPRGRAGAAGQAGGDPFQQRGSAAGPAS